MKNEYINIIMKTTNECNLRCKYCYHSSYDKERMTTELLNVIFEKTMPYYERVRLTWHGGEPMLLPLSFYEEAVRLEEKYIRSGTKIANGIQTNGTLITDEFACFIKENNFDIGISFDGLFNDAYRGLTENTIAGIELLRKYNIKSGSIATIGLHNVNKMVALYEDFKKNNLGVSMNPIFDAGHASSNSLSLQHSRLYIENVLKLFDVWAKDESCNIRLSSMERYVNTIINNNRKQCNHSDCRYRYISINPDGSVYPCGRPYPEEYKIGNIYDVNEISEVFNSIEYKNYVKKVDERREKCKQLCNVFDYCGSECNHFALIDNGLENISQFSCTVFQNLFISLRARLNQIREDIFINGNLKYNPFIVDIFTKKIIL